MVLRFFIGILGGSFVPCQVWSTGFFDKNVVGSANALTGGWGNAGGGIRCSQAECFIFYEEEENPHKVGALN
jgi:nitrate/nitrite transporter NarK